MSFAMYLISNITRLNGKKLLNESLIYYFVKVDSSNSSKDSDKINVIDLPPEPTNCCMSGCANCVWIEYAEKLTKLFNGETELARAIILTKIQDPNMKAFLQMELKSMGKR